MLVMVETQRGVYEVKGRTTGFGNKLDTGKRGRRWLGGWKSQSNAIINKQGEEDPMERERPCVSLGSVLAELLVTSDEGCQAQTLTGEVPAVGGIWNLQN